MVEEAPLYIVLAFPGSNPLHKVDGREPGEASRHLWAVKGVVGVLNGLRAPRGPQ